MPKGSKKVAEVKQLQIHKEGHGTRDRNEMLTFFCEGTNLSERKAIKL